MYNKWTERGVEGGTAQDCQTRSINHRSNKTVGSVLSFEGEKRLQGGKFHARGRVAHTITHVDIRGDFRVRGCVSLRVVCCAALWGYNLDMNQPSVRFIFPILYFFSSSSSFVCRDGWQWWCLFDGPCFQDGKKPLPEDFGDFFDYFLRRKLRLWAPSAAGAPDRPLWKESWWCHVTASCTSI